MSLEDRLDEDNAEAWKPTEAGEKLIGEIVDLSTRTTEYGPYRIVTVKPKDGPAKAFHAYHTVAADQLNGQYPGIGEEIGIRYMGKAEGGSYGSGYQNYKIVVEHPAGWQPPSLEDEAARQDREAQEAATAGGEQAERDKQDESIPFLREEVPFDFEPWHAHSNR